MKKHIEFNNPAIIGNEIKNIQNLLIKKQYSGSGYFTKKCSDWLINNIKCKEALLVHSCTAALEMCAILLNIKSKDEIIMPSYTFVSTANAFVARNGTPVFVDIDPKTLNIEPKQIEKAITKRTKAIVVVHYAGISCDMQEIMKIAKKNNLYVVEDAAQSILCAYKNKPLGSMGDLATISFHDSKNIHCGEGGALLINNKKFIKRAKIIRDKGTNRDNFVKNLVRKYTWIDIGSSYVLSEIHAAFLYAQLIKSKIHIKKRLKIWKIYNSLLKNLEKNNFIKRPFIPKYAKHNGHIYFIIVKKKRSKILSYLKKRNIDALFHYVPLHNSTAGKKYARSMKSLNYTNFLSKNVIRLPMHAALKRKEQIYICNKIENFFIKNVN